MILLSTFEKIKTKFCLLTIVKALPWLFATITYKQLLRTNAHIKAFCFMHTTYVQRDQLKSYTLSRGTKTPDSLPKLTITHFISSFATVHIHRGQVPYFRSINYALLSSRFAWSFKDHFQQNRTSPSIWSLVQNPRHQNNLIRTIEGPKNAPW